MILVESGKWSFNIKTIDNNLHGVFTMQDVERCSFAFAPVVTLLPVLVHSGYCGQYFFQEHQLNLSENTHKRSLRLIFR